MIAEWTEWTEWAGRVVEGLRRKWKERNLMERDGKAWNVSEGPERVPE